MRMLGLWESNSRKSVSIDETSLSLRALLHSDYYDQGGRVHQSLVDSPLVGLVLRSTLLAIAIRSSPVLRMLGCKIHLAVVLRRG